MECIVPHIWRLTIGHPLSYPYQSRLITNLAQRQRWGGDEDQSRIRGIPMGVASMFDGNVCDLDQPKRAAGVLAWGGK